MPRDFEVHILTKNQYLPLSYRARLSSMESYNYHFYDKTLLYQQQFMVKREVIFFL